MAFQPFGFRFDIVSPLTLKEVKAAIRKHKTPWFGPRKAARGWIVGRFVCLQSGSSRYDPALSGWISHHGGETWIGGRAQSEPLLQFLRDAISPQGSAQVEPVARFPRNPILPENRARSRRLAAIPIPTALTLNVNGNIVDGPLTQDSIRKALGDTDSDDFMILEWSPTRFLQLATRGSEWVLEKYDGEHEEQVVVRPQSDAPDFAYDEILAVLIAYASGTEMPPHVMWQPIEEPW